jgi:thiol-disulfide isomerase/thioredoxin
MKKMKITLSLILLAVSAGVFAQKIEFPQTGFSTAAYITIKAVEITDTATIFDFHTRYTPGYWIKIPKDTYIYVVDTDTKLYVSGTEGIPFAEEFFMPESGETEYRLFFPPLDPSVTLIDYGEDDGNWHIYDIVIKESPETLLLPAEMYGHWFRGGEWNLSLFDTLAVYDNQVWKYQSVDSISGTILLANDQNNERTLFFKRGENGNMFFGDSPHSLGKLTRDPDINHEARFDDNSAFTEPLFKTGKAVLKGYFKGYTPRIGVKTGIIHVRDILSGDANIVLLNINSDGTFKVEVPLNNPQTVFLQSELFNGEMFLEPDKELFMIIDPTLAREMPRYKGYPVLFMGDNADISRWMYELMHIRRYYPADLHENILDITCEDYKARILEDLQKALADLKMLKLENRFNEKTYQFLVNDITYGYYLMIMSYDWRALSAYRQKTNEMLFRLSDIPGITPPDIDYYKFINDDLINNPLAILSSSYNDILSMMRHLDVLRADPSWVSKTQIFETMIEEGVILTPDEEILFNVVRLAETDEYKSNYKEIARLMPKIGNLSQKYNDQLMQLEETEASADQKDIFIRLAQKLEDEGVSLPEDEKDLLSMYKSCMDVESVKHYHAIIQEVENQMLMTNFKSNRNEIIDRIRLERNITEIINNTTQRLGISKGQATDILYAQYHCYRIVSELSPVSDAKMANIQQQISSPFIRQYLAAANDEARDQLEKNKVSGGYAIQDVPKSEAEELFSNIIEKYKGKLVYVDFWATWCGPCRSGMQQIKPLKEELEGMDVAFVYITGPSSPRGTWENLITDVKGDHYYLSKDEWNYLTAHFNIRGIPHYVLVGKEGEVINANVPQMSNDSLKNLFVNNLGNN